MWLNICSAVILLSAAVLTAVQAHRIYQSRIPNGNQVPSPCQEGAFWDGVGHQSPSGANSRNPFGLDFKAAGFAWTEKLCRQDSDGDGLTNGQELGDPDCVWTPGATPSRTMGLSHPGVCPLDATACTNAWTVCPKPFSCPALSEPHVTIKNFTINENTSVPAKHTTYICQAFELNSTTTPVHIIGSHPIIVNKNVVHHMTIYACSVKPNQTTFDSPKDCSIGRKVCNELMNVWAYGWEGECFNSNAGFRIGGNGFRYGLLELHWNNPTKRSGFTDSSGFSVYLTDRLRKYDLGTLLYGELNLVLPPRQPLINYNHTCPGVCTSHYHKETRYITAVSIHMHFYGIRGRVALWRNGTLVKDLSPLQMYDYNSPKKFIFDPPIEYLRGDEVKSECYFSTSKSNVSIFYGQGSSEEMCYTFIYYYPNNMTRASSDKLSICTANSGINYCWTNSGITPQIEQDCNITGMINGQTPKRVLRDMSASGCFSRIGCDPKCRNYLNNTLWPLNSCYDPKRARQMAEAMSSGAFATPTAGRTISATLFGQRFCKQEIAMLADIDRRSAMVAATDAAHPTESTDLMSEQHLHHHQHQRYHHHHRYHHQHHYHRVIIAASSCAAVKNLPWSLSSKLHCYPYTPRRNQRTRTFEPRWRRLVVPATMATIPLRLWRKFNQRKALRTFMWASGWRCICQLLGAS